MPGRTKPIIPDMKADLHFASDSLGHSGGAAEILAGFRSCFRRAHLRNSPPSLLMIGNNYLKQLAISARANSPAPICRSISYNDSESENVQGVPVGLSCF